MRRLGEAELLVGVIGGAARDLSLVVVAAVGGHVRGGVGGPVDGVEGRRCCVIGAVVVEDGVSAAVVEDAEGSEGFAGAEHWCDLIDWCIYMLVWCGCSSVSVMRGQLDCGCLSLSLSHY